MVPLRVPPPGFVPIATVIEAEHGASRGDVRDGPNGDLLPTPTTEDSLWETKEGGDEELP